MDMNKLYEDAFRVLREERMLYRGFLMERSDKGVSILDIRNPYYKTPSNKDLKVLVENGFVLGATILLMESDRKKILRYKKLTEAQVKLSEGAKVSPRKLQEYKNSIDRYRLEINYYESQICRWQQFIKYNSN